MDIERTHLAVESLVELSGRFLLATKMEENVGELIAFLATVEDARLTSELQGDAERKAFWINLYNAFNLYFMRQFPNSAPDRKTRLGHFIKKQITVAGKALSLVDIENGILRRSKTLWGLGYVGKFFVGGFEKRHRVDRLDPRIHFALNCGAESCPPIRFYTPETIEAELDLATRAYLSTEVKENAGMVSVSALFNMYRGDFGGKTGAWNFIRKYRGDLPPHPAKLSFAKWDWTQNLDAFA